MTALLHGLWEPPPRDAPTLQRQAYRYMLQALRRVERRVPGVLTAPDQVSGAQVMEAACATLMNPKIPAVLRTGALTMLQRRMHSVDPDTPERLYLARDPHHNPIAPDFGDQLAALDQFEDALHEFLTGPALAQRAPEGGESDAATHALLYLGVLQALLVTRLGCCAMAALAQVTAKAGNRPYVGRNWAWVDLEIPGAAAAPQLRRLFLDPVVLAAWLALRAHSSALPTPALHLKAGKQAAFRARLARESFKTLVTAMDGAGRASPVRSLRALCAAETQRLYVTTMPLLATYAKGELVSTSLDPGTWARLLGCTPVAEAALVTGDPDATPLPSDVNVPPRETTEAAASEAAAQGDLDEQGLIARLRDAMRGPRSEWPAGFDRLLDEYAGEPGNTTTTGCLVRWLRYLTVEYRSHGKRLRDGSIHYYRGLLANRLLEYLPMALDGIGEGELHDAYAGIIESRTSNGQVRNLRMALGAFDRYVRAELYPALPRTQLLGDIEGTYTISNRIVSVAEYFAGLGQINDGSLVIANEALRQQLRVFWILAFRLGMRRREILGLQVRDVDFPYVWVRANPARTLKTPNAHRLLTLEAVRGIEREIVRAPVPKSSERDDYVFFGRRAPSAAELDAHAVVALANTLLERITGDPHLHPHNLRHSFATLYLLGSLGQELGTAVHPCAIPFLRDAIDGGTALARLASGTLHRYAARGAALGMLMGHGSERTTYEHYVHGLDLLLFVACTDPYREPSRLSLPARLARSRKQISAFLDPTTRPRVIGATLFDTLAAVVERHPQDVIVLRASETPDGAAASEDRTIFGATFPTLNGLMARADAKQPGYPSTQAERDTAEALLAAFGKVPTAKRLLLGELLQRWAVACIKNEHWASMPAAAAQLWITDAFKLGRPLPLSAARVTRDAQGDKKRFYAIPKPLDPRSYGKPRGRYWIRFTDMRRRRMRKRDIGLARRRARTQPTITWLVTTLALVLTISVDPP